MTEVRLRSRIRVRIIDWLTLHGLTNIVRLEARLRGLDLGVIEHRRLQDRFSFIYKTGYWAEQSSESLSGFGSRLATTVGIRSQLPEILRDLKVRTLVDVGCGDLNWIRHVDLPCDYIGVDIVPSVIAANRTSPFGKGREFHVLDATKQVPPSCDAVLCREVIFHLSLRDVARLLKNVRASGARYLIATTNPDVAVNTDIVSGLFRETNLQIKPFKLGKPVHWIADGEGDNPDRQLAVWAL